MKGGNTTVRLFVTSAVLQRSVTIEFRLDHRIRRPPHVGAAEGCDLLILLIKKNQKIAACGSSYRGISSVEGTPLS
jgi:hypothetical protein